MRGLPTRTRLMAAVMAGAAWLGSAHAQQPQQAPPAKDAGFHRMEIYNGSVATVHYVPFGKVAAADQAKMSEQEQRERHASLAGDLFALLHEYVQNERRMERRRTAVQQLFYGYSSSTWTAYSLGGGWYYPWCWAAPAYSQANTTLQGLGVGPVDEGVIKTELARVLAQMVAPAPGPQPVPPPKAARDSGPASAQTAAARR
jgi:hypothetical protein